MIDLLLEADIDFKFPFRKSLHAYVSVHQLPAILVLIGASTLYSEVPAREWAEGNEPGTGKIYAGETGKTFDDVAGQDRLRSLVEIIDFLTTPKIQ